VAIGVCESEESSCSKRRLLQDRSSQPEANRELRQTQKFALPKVYLLNIFPLSSVHIDVSAGVPLYSYLSCLFSLCIADQAQQGDQRLTAAIDQSYAAYHCFQSFDKLIKLDE